MALLELSGLSKHFGGTTAVDQLDLRVEEGEIVSLIGPNGAGKTTAFNVITGLCAPDGGDIRFQGRSLRGLPAHEIAARGIARTFQSLRIFTNMTVLENVMVGQHARGHAGALATMLRLPGFRREEERIRQQAVQALSLFGERLTGFRLDQLAYSLSYANRRRLEIARALATQPKMLLLDEPTAGMNPHETQEMTGMIGLLRERGYTILLIEHDMKVVQGVSDRVVALDYGCKIAEGSYQEVACNARVIEAYLGRRPCDAASESEALAASDMAAN
jgi:branched-chain amino acid transport system ATP-binding protein